MTNWDRIGMQINPVAEDESSTNLGATWICCTSSPAITHVSDHCNSLSKSFGAEDLFHGVSFSIAKGARFALVGPNGIGKTTLLRILMGLEEPSAGKVTRARSLRIGYLPQEADFQLEGTVWDACMAVFADLIRQQEELAKARSGDV